MPKGAWNCLAAVFCDSYNNQIKALFPSSQHITTSRKGVGETSGYDDEGIARDPSACSGSVKAVAPSKLTYLLRGKSA